jgi:hypothetical protein
MPNAAVDDPYDVDSGDGYQKAFNRWFREIRAGAETSALRARQQLMYDVSSLYGDTAFVRHTFVIYCCQASPLVTGHAR